VLQLRVSVQQPVRAAKRPVGVYVASRTSARGRVTRIGTVTAPRNARGTVRRVHATGRLRLARRAPGTPLRFLVACLGRPRADHCVVAARPLFITPRRAR
jgi:hypothetical protein